MRVYFRTCINILQCLYIKQDEDIRDVHETTCSGSTGYDRQLIEYSLHADRCWHSALWRQPLCYSMKLSINGIFRKMFSLQSTAGTLEWEESHFWIDEHKQCREEK